VSIIIIGFNILPTSLNSFICFGCQEQGSYSRSAVLYYHSYHIIRRDALVLNLFQHQLWILCCSAFFQQCVTF